MSILTPSQVSLPASLVEARVQGLPSAAYYIADFISVEEEKALLEKIALSAKWKQLSKRRLQTWPSDLSKNALLEGSLPTWLIDPILPRLTSLPVEGRAHIFSDSPHHAPNHVLINEYLPGQGIMPHKDGSSYHPVVCTVSLGSSLCLDVYGTNMDGTREQNPRWKLLQEPRSLLITAEELYTDYLHGIEDTAEEHNLGPETVSNWSLLRCTEDIIEGKLRRQARTSLTFRDVLKVVKLSSRFPSLGKR